LLRPSLHWLVFAAALAMVGGSRPALADESRTFESFADLRNELLNDMGGATHRLWLVTDFLTDGELVSALYVAQYRKLDVQVLLGRAKANHYMSRLNYLKNQNIPAYLKPETLKPSRPTAILCDDKLYLVDGELDFMAKYKKYTVDILEGPEASSFAAAFAAAANLKLPAVAHQLPLVGKAGGRGRVYVPSPASTYSAHAEPGVYTYDHHKQPRPEGVPAKLPKSLKWEEAEHERSQVRSRQPETRPVPPVQPAPPALPGDNETPMTGNADTKDGG
jgi:hypothetical protein